MVYYVWPKVPRKRVLYSNASKINRNTMLGYAPHTKEPIKRLLNIGFIPEGEGLLVALKKDSIPLESRIEAGAWAMVGKFLNSDFPSALRIGDAICADRTLLPSFRMRFQFIHLYRFLSMRKAKEDKDLLRFKAASELGDEAMKLMAEMKNEGDKPGFGINVLELFSECLELTTFLVGELGWSPSEELMGTNPNYGIMQASVEGNLHRLKFFIKRGAKVNTRSESGENTPLSFAVAKNHPDVVQCLLSNGAGFANNIQKDTWVHEAQMNSCRSLVPQLKKAPVLDKSGCFAATACFGDYNAPEVVVLRRFRDERMLKSEGGRWMVRTYYQISPPIARLIRRSRILKKIIRRGFLIPIVRYLEK